jgi:hypothetical protein
MKKKELFYLFREDSKRHEFNRLPSNVNWSVFQHIEMYFTGKIDILPKMYVDYDGSFYFFDIDPSDIEAYTI